MLFLYTLAVFVSALLLFSIQPHVGKALLPVMGGTPAVWNTCMLFFQAALLVGYGYAFATSKFLNVRKQGILHLVLMAAAFFFLPLQIVMSGDWSDSPTWPLLVGLTTSVGLPFVMNSTSAPLLQRWFADTDHPRAHNPYPLYAASNAGSLLALLAYPFLVERTLSLTEQATAHLIVFALLSLLLAGCLGLAWRRLVPLADTTHTTEAPNWGLRGRWLVMSFIPSSLLLGVTMALTLDVAAIPLLWVVPLAIYILSFVLAFSTRPPPHRWMVALYPISVVALAPILITHISVPIVGVGLAHLTVFFLACMAFHGELNRTKPHPAHLTEFYLIMSIGGVLGGIFNALIAPAIFSSIIEYPLVLVVSVVALTFHKSENAQERLVLAAVAVALIAGWTFMVFPHDTDLAMTLSMALTPVVLAGVFWNARALRFGIPIMYAVLWITLSQNTREVLFEDRGYFGVSTVIEDKKDHVRLMYHGTTSHGGQSDLPGYERWVLPYHYPGSPVGQIWHSMSERRKGSRVGVLGLGPGGLACMAAPGESVVFFEIDPVVARVAKDPKFFTFLSECGADIIMGDGRIMVSKAKDAEFGLLVVDVFGSDSLPVHLFTREAIQIYTSKLDADGLLAFHISSRYADLTPMLATIADEMGWDWRIQNHHPTKTYPVKVDGTRFFVMAPTTAALGTLVDGPEWKKPDGRVPAFTDQRADLFSVMKFSSK
jgi:hypothetical protein